MLKLVFSLCLVIVGMGLGYLVQVADSRKNLDLPLEDIRKTLQRMALLFFNPVAILGATWAADIRDIKIAALPALGALALVSGGAMAFFISRGLRLTRPQTGAYVVCGGFTNIGSLGALFCFLFLGESGFALVPFYKLFEETLYYAVGFPLAKSFSSQVSQASSVVSRLRSVAADPFVLAGVLGIGTGLALNLSGLPRPGIYGLVNSVFIPLAAFLLLVSIGMAMRFSRIGAYLVPGLLTAGIKFVLVPVLVVGTGMMLGLGQMDQGPALKVVLILSAMPVGFIAMVPPTLYRLDVDLANACWLVTNTGLLLVVPVILFILQFL